MSDDIERKNHGGNIPQKRDTVRLAATELGISCEEMLRVLTAGAPLGEESARLMLAMFGAEDMARAIDWEALNVRCPI